MAGYSAVKCRFAKEIGERRFAFVQCDANSDHFEREQIDEALYARGWDAIAAHIGERTCKVCGSPAHMHGTASNRVYDTEDGELHPGDMYFADWHFHDENGKCVGNGWTNCDGKHLHVVLPNGHHWDVDGRASNCTLPNDTTHRCWVRHGEPPNVTVDKAGQTCQAGAGTILSGDYHGFLRNGELTAG